MNKNIWLAVSALTLGTTDIVCAQYPRDDEPTSQPPTQAPSMTYPPADLPPRPSSPAVSTGNNSVNTQAAIAAMRRAADAFYTLRQSGGYLYRYDLQSGEAWGEFKEPAPRGRIWLQPPGTPSVGQALLQVYRATRDVKYLNMAREAGAAIVREQQPSGGWYYFADPQERRGGGFANRGNGSNTTSSSLDDDTTTGNIRFLLQLDAANKAVRAADAPARAVRASVNRALQSLLQAQYQSGAWPLAYTKPVDSRAAGPARRARRNPNARFDPQSSSYRDAYTLNDNLIRNAVSTLRLAYLLNPRPNYLAALRRAGDFLVLAQLPEPTPLWAQQYDFDMTPRWGRQVEPPSAASAESISAMRALMEIHLVTGDAKYLAPLESAFAFYDRAAIEPNKWARFYDLTTGQPIYVDEQGEIVSGRAEAISTYAWDGEFGVGALRENYRRLKSVGRGSFARILDAENDLFPLNASLLSTLTSAERTAALQRLTVGASAGINQLESDGFYRKNGQLTSSVFITRVAALARYVELSSGATGAAVPAVPSGPSNIGLL
ncbi:MAG TPA: pectate lyase [Abditibacteriaceae bacterium]|jgi:hypothetical protein